ncbi:MAG: hypothetical protein HKN12_12120, partial [Gemmatimonadetes bacterium]|nr:hypothetical protein [Gemmatimonadota bacterium]
VVKIAGRAEAPGRPLLYGTTKEFLGYFGLGSLDEMPRTEELQALLAGQSMPGHVIDEDTGELVPAPAATVTLTETPSGDDEGEELPDGGPSAEDSDGENPPEEAAMGYAEEEEDETLPPEAPDAEDLSHSGEESDDREGVPATLSISGDLGGGLAPAL